MTLTLDSITEPAPPLANVALGPHPAPVPDPVDVPLGPAPDWLRPAVRAMVNELADHYKGADPGSIDKAIATIKPISASPKSWGSREMAAEAVKVYRASTGGTPATPTVKKESTRTTAAKPRRTTAVRTKPAPAVPVVVQPSVPPAPEPVVREPVPQPVEVVQPDPIPQPEPVVRTAPLRRPVVWPVMLLAAPAFVAVWSGWVGLGKLTGFGKVNLLPGIGKGWVIDSAITLPVGVETYGAYALYIWLSGRVPARARTFAKWSAIASLVVGALGQVAYHLLVANGVKSAPWQITTLVACLPVAVLGMGAALAHLVRGDEN